jgi:hypothetical protein
MAMPRNRKAITANEIKLRRKKKSHGASQRGWGFNSGSAINERLKKVENVGSPGL